MQSKKMKENMDKLKERKKKIIKLLNIDFNDVNILIYMLIKKNNLDNLISKLDDVNTPTNCTSIVKKGYLTSEEQFLSILYNFIHHINTDFWFMNNYRISFIKTILSNDEAENLLLTKKYFHDNNNIPYYKYHFHKTTILNFYNIIIKIPQTKIIKCFLKKHNIDDINKININNAEDVEKIYKILKLICICNNDRFALLYLFESKVNDKMIDMLKIQLETLIKRTYKKEKAILTLFNDD